MKDSHRLFMRQFAIKHSLHYHFYKSFADFEGNEGAIIIINDCTAFGIETNDGRTYFFTFTDALIAQQWIKEVQSTFPNVVVDIY